MSRFRIYHWLSYILTGVLINLPPIIGHILGAKINCSQKIKTSGVWTEGKPEQLRPWSVRCKIQGDSEDGGNCFWH